MRDLLLPSRLLLLAAVVMAAWGAAVPETRWVVILWLAVWGASWAAIAGWGWSVVRWVGRVWAQVPGVVTIGRWLLRPVCAVQWPVPVEEPLSRLVYSAPATVLVANALANEYGQYLVWTARLTGPPLWLALGFGSWFAEQASGQPYWRPDSRVCVAESEITGGSRALWEVSAERRARLLARYYWEVRTLAEEGRLSEALRARGRRLEALRPRLRAEEE